MNPRTDLVILAADKDIERLMIGLLARPADLSIRAVTAVALVHPQHDPGCRRSADLLLRPYLRTTDRALVVLDREGSGAEGVAREALEADITQRLARNGWEDRADAIVIAPEVEAWVWCGAPALPAALGWGAEPSSLRPWLRERGLWTEGPKPADPKAAVEAALRHKQLPRSSALYGKVAAMARVDACQDAAFVRLRERLQSWFPPNAPPQSGSGAAGGRRPRG